MMVGGVVVKRLTLIVFLLIIGSIILSVHTFAVTSNVSVEGRLDAFSAFSALNASITNTVTAAAFYGTFEGTYTGVDVKAASFLFPYLTSEAHLRMPFNASITSVEVYVSGGTSAVGRLDIGANNASNTAGTGWMLATGTALPWTYAAYTDIKFTTPAVTGPVTMETIQFYYKRLP
jgi:hypothetical protein